MKRAIFPLTLSVLLAGWAAAQETATGSAESVQVNLVEIPVNVFDRSGEPVRGLKPENFEVYDEGKRRKITHFEEIDLAKLSGSDVTSVHNPAARRSFLLTFDLTNSGPKALLKARQGATVFLTEAIRERDLVAVATFSVQRGFRILTAFTTDRDLARLAIQDLGTSQFYESRDPLRLAQAATPFEQTQGLEKGFLQDAATEVQEILSTRTEQINEQYFRQRVERQLSTFGNVARMLDSVRGRKQLVLLSEGFSGQLIHGREQTAQEDAAVYRGEIWKIDNDQRFGNSATVHHLDEMAQLFRRSDVVLHSIDIHGVPEATDVRSASARSSSDSLYLMSTATGGQVFRSTNDIGASFAKLLRQQEVIYVLGIQVAPSGNEGKYHDLSVKVKVVGHSGLRASHRAGYYEPRAQISAVEQTLSATDILMNDIPFEELDVRLLVAPFPAAADAAAAPVPVIAEISGSDLLERVKGDALNAEIFIYAFDDQNKVRDFLFQTVAFDLSKMRPAIQARGIKYYGTLSLPPGDYSIKSLVRVLESGYKGFRRARVHIPDSDQPSILPPLFFEAPGQWVMLKGAKTAEGQVDYPFMLHDESFIPSVRPQMTSGGTYKVALFTFNFPSEEMQLVARVEGSDGSQRNPQLKLIGRTTREEGSVKLLLDFSPHGLEPGTYALHLSAKPPNGDVIPTTSLMFDVSGQ